MSSYAEKFKDPRWQKKRLEIFERDRWACVRCKKKDEELQVHHRCYEKGKDPWDYPDEILITLCACCHGHITETLAEVRGWIHEKPLDEAIYNIMLFRHRGQLDEVLEILTNIRLMLELQRIAIKEDYEPIQSSNDG
jgi:hypothetical protein